MKSLFLITILFFIVHFSNGQSSNNGLVPDSSYFVFTADIGRISKSMPIKDMNDYQFIQQMVKEVTGYNKEELTLEEIGMDLSGSIHMFSGIKQSFSFHGFSIPLKDQSSFLKNELVPLEFRTALKNENVAYNERRLAFIHGNTYMMMELNWKDYLFEEVVDSIFDANHWERPYRWGGYEDYQYTESIPMEESIEFEQAVEEMEEVEEAEEMYEAPPAEESDYDYYEEKEDMYQKYERILDSVMDSRIPKITEAYISSLKEGNVLSKTDKNYASTQTQVADGSIYLNPAIANDNRNNYYQMQNPLLGGMNRFTKETWQSGYINFTKTGLTVDWNTHGDERFMKVMKAGMNSEFNEDLLSYIPENTQGFALYNMNGLGAYEAMKESYMPVLDESEKPEYLLASAIWSTLDELVDEEAVFDIYSANMFVTYNGLQKMMLERTTYDYDEETFEYEEQTENYEDQVPIMTFGVYTEKAYLMEKYMKAWRAYHDIGMEKIGDYYRFEKGPIGGTPYYIAIIDNIILISNDESLMKNNLKGYGKDAISGDRYKAAKASQSFYANMNMEELPKDFKTLTTNQRERDLFESMKDKTGNAELAMKGITDNKQTIQLNYTFDGKYKNGAYYMMDIMNTIFERTNN